MFHIPPSEFWSMTIKEWFWVMYFKSEMNRAEMEAIEEAKGGARTVKAPPSVWKELREDLRRRNGDS